MAVRKVGSCRILREVARGGMGVVYEAYQDGLDRRVAVKALEPGQDRSTDRVERFRREGRAYAQIRHDAIPIVHDLVQKDEALYLVTEFVDGADLHQLLAKGGALPPACVAAVGARLADALDCVHSHALLHRDVKPANVMISVRGDVKLMDFGIAKDPMATELTRTGTVVGSPGYVAPEVLEGEPATERSDVWSAGVTLYELATWMKPFMGDDFHQLFAAIRKARPIPIRDVVPSFPRRLARAIERCLERRPSRRWESAGALAAELEACAARLLGDARPRERLAALMLERGVSEEADAEVAGDAEAAGDGRPPDVTRAAEPATVSLGSARPSNRRIGWAFAAAMALAGLYALYMGW
jgi:eukaryotic-like serine/threonine-protein kinase